MFMAAQSEVLEMHTAHMSVNRRTDKDMWALTVLLSER